MKTIIWKIRFSIELRRILRLPWGWCWDSAGSWVEMLKGDLSECPKGCAEEEFDSWRASL